MRARNRAGQLDVHGEPYRTGYLGTRVLPGDRFADHLKCAVHRQWGRFALGNVSLDLTYAGAGDAERKFLNPRVAVGHGQTFRDWLMACMASMMCG